MAVAENFQFSHQGVPPLRVRAPKESTPFFLPKTRIYTKEFTLPCEAAKRTGSSVGIRVCDSNLPRLWRRRDWLAEPLPARRAEHTQEAGTEEQDGAGLRGNVLGLGELTANLAAWESGIMDVDVRISCGQAGQQGGLCARGRCTVSSYKSRVVRRGLG